MSLEQREIDLTLEELGRGAYITRYPDGYIELSIPCENLAPLHQSLNEAIWTAIRPRLCTDDRIRYTLKA